MYKPAITESPKLGALCKLVLWSDIDRFAPGIFKVIAPVSNYIPDETGITMDIGEKYITLQSTINQSILVEPLRNVYYIIDKRSNIMIGGISSKQKENIDNLVSKLRNICDH